MKRPPAGRAEIYPNRLADCLFCRIIDRQIPSAMVYENEDVLGFKDVNPQAPVHILFVPKKHIPGVHAINSSNQDSIQRLVLAATSVAREHGVEASGYRLVINCRKEGGQTVDHLHLHLLGGRKMNWPPG